MQILDVRILDVQILGVKLVYVPLAAVATTVLGLLWYSPLLYAKPWMLAMGYDPNDKAGLEEMREGTGKLRGPAWPRCFWRKTMVVATVITVPSRG